MRCEKDFAIAIYTKNNINKNSQKKQNKRAQKNKTRIHITNSFKYNIVFILFQKREK